MRYFPVMLDLKGRPVVFVGGGGETEAKVQRLVEAGARVTLISPEAHPALEPLAAAGRIRWERRAYREGDLAGAVLAFAHPKDPAVTGRVFAEAERRGVFLNAVDAPRHASFILPAVHRQGDLVVAVSTSGKAPALAVRLKERFARELGPEYAAFLELLGGLREEVARRVPGFAARRRLWYALVDSKALEWLRTGQPQRAQAQLRAVIEAYAKEGIA
ncbi:precorrin-2 dehydrogenase/sirohydrochlorin ferrochelatase family protein [Marinithermus hydrothermalis]|uniref:precorrin-2 dehydrogenase n=1 Tax=Marinithermus hydrothermalis (strain DSM 14884 / JCM 11576 / T1) TaxID=869210 RepID=F2NR22_MARHT|nr:bifunctional precorrin-2 dehydrogenase/sirohydrochlorin ferrochelatase [Marinithermus hydrothermalis]AEB12600.1 siroheme synthase [Marinithermus hydrothermalis DSM 14884]